MRKGILFFLIPLICITILHGQEETQKIDEYVDVIHAEILLRAIRDGKTVGGLTEKDLILYENGKNVKISSMVEVKRQMKIQKMDLETEPDMIRKPRFFLLYFWITSPQNNIPEALDYFFTEVYQKEDQVVLAVKDRAFQIKEEENIISIRKEFESYVLDITSSMLADIKAVMRRLENLGQDIRILMQQMENPQGNPPMAGELKSKKIDLVLEAKYRSRHYKDKYFMINEKKLQDLSESLKAVKMEKWGIMFFQPPTYPFVDMNNNYIKKFLSENLSGGGEEGGSDSADLSVDREQLMLEMGKPQNLLGIQKIRQAFFEADVTFHMIQLDSDISTSSSQEFVRRYHLGNKWETAFKKIVEATGGEIQRGKNILEAMNRISEKEDVHYILTYIPNESVKSKRNITFKSKQKEIKLFHHRRVNINMNREIVVENITYQFPTLGFKLKNFRMKLDNNRLLGRVRLKITAIDSENRMEQFEREFSLNLEEVDVSLTLHLVQGEQYDITVDALDIHSKKRSVSNSRIKIPVKPTNM